MHLREMRLSDYEQVYALWSACKGMGLNNIDESRAGIERFLQRNPTTCFVAQEQGKIIGAILAGNDGRRAYIYHLAVHPDYRRQKIATKLVHQALQELKAQGITKVALVAFSRNEEGNLFWEKLGFKARKDLTYRDMALCDLVRTDT